MKSAVSKASIPAVLFLLVVGYWFGPSRPRYSGGPVAPDAGVIPSGTFLSGAPDRSAAAPPSRRTSSGTREAATPDQEWIGAELAVWESINDPLRAEEFLMAMLGRVPESGIPRALEQIQRIPGSGAAALGERLVRRWAVKEPEEAIQWIQNHPGDAQNAWMTQAALTWAEEDLHSAIAWAESQEVDPTGIEARLAVAQEAARTIPTKALDLSVGLPSGPGRDRVLGHGIAQWADHDGAGAEAWIEALPPGEMREELRARAAVAMAETRPMEAAQLLVSGLPAGERQSSTAIQVAQRWVQQDARATLEWISGWPVENDRIQAIESTVPIWIHQQGDTVGEWLRSQPAGWMRDQVASQLVSVVARSDSAAAAGWASFITDPSLRRDAEGGISGPGP